MALQREAVWVPTGGRACGRRSRERFGQRRHPWEVGRPRQRGGLGGEETARRGVGACGGGGPAKGRGGGSRLWGSGVSARGLQESGAGLGRCGVVGGRRKPH